MAMPGPGTGPGEKTDDLGMGLDEVGADPTVAARPAGMPILDMEGMDEEDIANALKDKGLTVDVNDATGGRRFRGAPMVASAMGALAEAAKKGGAPEEAEEADGVELDAVVAGTRNRAGALGEDAPIAPEEGAVTVDMGELEPIEEEAAGETVEEVTEMPEAEEDGEGVGMSFEEVRAGEDGPKAAPEDAPVATPSEFGAFTTEFLQGGEEGKLGEKAVQDFFASGGKGTPEQ